MLVLDFGCLLRYKQGQTRKKGVPLAEITVELTDDTAIFRVAGDYTHEDQVRALKQIYPSTTHPHIIWDFTNSSLKNVHGDHMRKAAKVVKEHSGRPNGGITVFVCPSPAVFGVFRQYKAYAEIENLPFRYHVTRCLDEAMEYIARSSQKPGKR